MNFAREKVFRTMLQTKWKQNITPLACLLAQRKVVEKPFFGTPPPLAS